MRPIVAFAHSSRIELSEEVGTHGSPSIYILTIGDNAENSVSIRFFCKCCALRSFRDLTNG